MNFKIRIEKNNKIIEKINVSFNTYQSLCEKLDKIIELNGWDKNEVKFVVEGYDNKDVLDGWLGHKN